MQEPQPTIRLSRIHCYDERDGAPDPPPWLVSFRTGTDPGARPAAARTADSGRTPQPPHRQAM